MRYVIVSPPYRHQSAGIRVLYELQKYLVRIGCDAIVINLPIHIEPYDVAILPEVIPRQLFPYEKCVRWYLNHPIPGIDYLDDEIKVCYNYDDIPDAEFLLRIPGIEPFFVNRNEPRTKECVFVGKYIGYVPDEYKLDKYIHLRGDYPVGRFELANVLNKSKVLYTFDDKTMIAYEARLCGCEVIVVDSEGNKEPFQFHDDKYVDYEPYRSVVKLNMAVKERFFNEK